ncbi:MAG: SDR family oxidoreductase, partial [Halanaerobiales bacterium]|nr:SDR family oxidoreductase [Halanaerobiales bacterium]
EHLAKELPEYMIPMFLIKLEKIPLMLNGKINRKVLPEVDESQLEGKYEPPMGHVEETMVKVFEEILGREPIGVEDDYISLGGDSIKAMQIRARLVTEGINFKIKDLFDLRTIRRIGKNVNTIINEVIVPQKEVQGQVLLTPVQQWYFQQQFQYYFNQSNIFKLKENVNLELLEKALRKIIEHHDSLRMTYRMDENEIIQYNRGMNEIQFKLQLVDLSTFSDGRQDKLLREIIKKIQSFDLRKDLLIKAVIFDLGERGKRLLIAVHHLIIDAVSWQILLENLTNLYDLALEYKLPLKTTSFQEWSYKLYQYGQTANLDLEYWYKIDPTSLARITEKEVKDNCFSDLKDTIVELNKEDTSALLTKVHLAYDTQINDILLSALTMALTETFNLDNLCLILEGHGREEIITNVDLCRTIGWFTNIYPVYFERKSSIEETIKEVKGSLRRVPNKGMDYGIARFLKGNLHLSKLNPLISFNYFGNIGEIFEDNKKDRDRLITISEEAPVSIHPKNNYPYILDFNAFIFEKGLRIKLSYNDKYLAESSIKILKTLLIDKLKEIINHCTISCTTFFKEELNLEIIKGVANHLTEDLIVSPHRLESKDILLTGATGYFGSHLLNELIESTKANIYCLIREKDGLGVKERLLDLLNLYFPDKFTTLIDKRIFPIVGDITLTNFGLSEEKYSRLGAKIDTVIHTAALVKYYGLYSELKKVNVSGTEECIKFALKNDCWLHYSSTKGVIGSKVSGNKKIIFTENDFYLGQNFEDNVYSRTKFEAENLIHKAINTGLKATIYRMGNISGRYTDGHFQINIEDNQIYNMLKTLIESGIISEEIKIIPLEFAPADESCKAFVKIMKTEEALNRVFHLHNPKTITISEIVSVFNLNGFKIHIVDNHTFKNYINRLLEKDYKKMIWLFSEENTDFGANVELDPTLTAKYLKQIGYDWPEIDEEYIVKILRYMRLVGFIK